MTRETKGTILSGLLKVANVAEFAGFVTVITGLVTDNTDAVEVGAVTFVAGAATEMGVLCVASLSK